MRTLGALAIIFAFAMLLVGQLSGEAIAIAVILTIVTMTWRRLLRAASRRPIASPGKAQAAAWLRAVAALPGDTVRVGVALLRALGSGKSAWRAVDVPFRFGGRDDPADAGRRAVAVIAGSLSPDRIVVDIGPGSATAATHRLANGRDGTPDWLT